MSNEQIISEFLRTAYTDDKLAALLAHAEDGKLAYTSCCCFIGVATADHALQGQLKTGTYTLPEDHHYKRAERLEGATGAEFAYMLLSRKGDFDAADAERRTKLIPLIHAEIARREAERNSEASKPELAHTV